MSAHNVQKTANLYRGWPQPAPNKRLAQIRIFLADEDYHRKLGFKQNLAEIEEYITFLEKSDRGFDKHILMRIKEMIDVHRSWIKRATGPPSTSYVFARYPHRNRLLGLVKDSKRRAQLARIKAPELNRNLIPGPALHKGMEKEDRPASPDPFLYTKQLVEIRRRQDAEAEQVQGSGQSAVLKEPIPTNFNGPYTTFYKLTIAEAMERINIISETVGRLHDAANLAPRPFIYEIISIITQFTEDGRVNGLERLDATLTNEDLQRLLKLTEPSWNASVKVAIEDLSEDGSAQSSMFAQLIELFNSDLWPNEDSEASLDDLLSRFRSDVKGEPMAEADLEAFLLEMNDLGSIRYDVTSRTVRKPLLDRHPEDDLPKELCRITAQRLGSTLVYLENLLRDDERRLGILFLRDTSSISSIKQRVEAKFPLPIVGPTQSRPQKSSRTEEQGTRHLQKQTILEQHHNWDDREPNFQKLWAFASTIDNPRRFFALDRWPPELQTSERRDEIARSGPASPSPERSSEEDFPHPKENETFYPGETYFPFGETPYHETLLGRQIELNRLDARIPQAPSDDAFQLPELPESELPALMDYTARLGLLGKRNRSIDDEDAFTDHICEYPSLPFTAPGAPAVPTTKGPYPATEFSTPPPEFKPQMIGEKGMHVTGSPAGTGSTGRGRGRGRGRGQLGSSSNNGSRGLGRGIGRGVSQQGWFGPKLGAKAGGIGSGSGSGDGSGGGDDGDGDDDIPGGSGTTGSGSPSILGWVRRPKASSSSATASSSE